MSRPRPFIEEAAVQKVRAAAGGLNICDPAEIAFDYTPDADRQIGRNFRSDALRSKNCWNASDIAT